MDPVLRTEIKSVTAYTRMARIRWARVALFAVGLSAASAGCSPSGARSTGESQLSDGTGAGTSVLSAASSSVSVATTLPEDSVSGVTGETSSPHGVNDQTTSTDQRTLAPLGDGADVVRGRVIDYWGHPLAGVAVGIGAERTATNDQGQFEFAGIGPSYDVSLVTRFAGEVVEVYGWRYEGLTRRDPTLQIYKGLPQREGRVTFEVTGLDGDSAYAEAAMGGVDGHRAYSVGSAKESLAAWRGAESVLATVHALSWEAPQGPRIPLVYLAHTTTQVTLKDHESTPINLNLTAAGEFQIANVYGDTLANRERDRVHLVFARFDDGPSLLLVSEPRKAASDTAFVYPAPQLEGMSLTIAVREDAKVAQGEYSIGYVSRVQPGDDVGVVEVHSPAQLIEPLDGALEVTRDTPCTWETDAGTSVVVFEDLQVFQAVYVVTSKTHATLPDLSGLGLFYSNHGQYTWAVETHGNAMSTDELTGEKGFLEPFSGDLNYPMGFNEGQGRFSRSSTRAFTAGKVNDSPFAR